MKKMSKKAFILIELLTVVVILGILTFIAIPSVTAIVSNVKNNYDILLMINHINMVI